VALLTTALVVTANCALVCPARTVTVAGTCAAALSLAKVTESPPVAAGPVKVTVPMVPAPPVNVDNVKAAEATVGGFTVNVAVLATPYVAVIVAGTDVPTAAVVTWNVAVDCPAATVTVAGTAAAALLLASVRDAADAATPFSVTVAVDAVPPVTAVGFKAIEVIAGFTRTLRLAVAV
jgi:hypothetical protein